MLVLSRYPRQVVMIGRDIQVVVLEIVGDRVRLGVTAPREIPVQRQEQRANLSTPTLP